MWNSARSVRLAVAVVGLTLVGTAVAVRTNQQPPSSAPKNAKPPTVLFMCPHGAAKSVLASAYFQRAAKERGLNVRVISAGTDPDPEVAPAVASHLKKGGYEVPVSKPRQVTSEDLATADVVISIGCDLKDLPAPKGTVVKWDDVPAPSQDFARADQMIRERVLQLVEELVRSSRAHLQLRVVRALGREWVMSTSDPLRAHLVRLLDWEEAHVGFDKAVAGIPNDRRGARPPGFEHSPWQLVEHIRLAQKDLLDFCVNPDYEHALAWPDDYWPKDPEPPSDAAWTASVREVKADCERVKKLASDPAVDLFALVPTGKDRQTVLRGILLVADHNAYHVGQLVAVRRALGDWR